MIIVRPLSVDIASVLVEDMHSQLVVLHACPGCVELAGGSEHKRVVAIVPPYIRGCRVGAPTAFLYLDKYTQRDTNDHRPLVGLR